MLPSGSDEPEASKLHVISGQVVVKLATGGWLAGAPGSPLVPSLFTWIAVPLLLPSGSWLSAAL